MTNPTTLPTASVLLPVHNGGAYLNAAIESVLAQSFTDYELLLLDDGSQDGSLECMKQHAALDARCRLHSWPNRGLVATLNEGVRLARGQILLRMDADDLCRPERFAQQIAYLEGHPECVAVGTQVMLIDPDGQPLRPFIETMGHDEIDAAHLAERGGAIAHPAVAIRKAAVLRVGGYRAGFPHAEDIDLFLRLAEVGRLANIAEVLLDYRQHAGSVGYRQAAQQRDSAARSVTEARQRRGLPILTKPRELCSVPATIADLHRMWGWWALAGRNLATARKHAFKAVTRRPFDLDNLKLLLCALRGH